MGYVKETHSHTKLCVTNPVDTDYLNYSGDPDTAERILEK